MNSSRIKNPKRLIICACALVVVCGAAVAFFVTHASVDAIHREYTPSYSWAFDPYDDSVLESRAKVIAKVQYTGNKHSYKTIYDVDVKTAYTVNILEIYKGMVNKDQIEIEADGGKISLKEWKANTDAERYAQDKFLLNASDAELEASTIECNPGNGVKWSKNDIAIVYLGYEGGVYYITFGGLALFEETKDGYFKNEESLLSFNAGDLKIIKDRNIQTVDSDVIRDKPSKSI